MVLDNRFKLGQKIAEGSYGSVYQAFDKGNMKHVAVKIVSFI